MNVPYFKGHICKHKSKITVASNNSPSIEALAIFNVTTTKTKGIMPFYFVIENGLKYRVNINLGNG